MKETEYILRLESINYQGDNIGNDLEFDLKIRGYGRKDVKFKESIKHNNLLLYKDYILQEQRIKRPFTLSVFASITEKDLYEDKGQAGKTTAVSLKTGKKDLQIKVKVVGDHIGDPGKTAIIILNFTVETIEIPIKRERSGSELINGPNEIPTEPEEIYPEFLGELAATQHEVIAFISDLHIGGDDCVDDFDQKDDEEFSRMINYLEVVRQATSKKKMDLVIVGDFLEMWETKNYAGSQDSKAERVTKAKFKLDKIAAKHPVVFQSIRKFQAASKQNKVYYLYGNHDDEILSREVMSHIRKATDVQFLFGTRGSAKEYQNKTFKVYAEHGHRFDKANFTKDPFAAPPLGRWVVENFVTELELITAGKDCKSPFGNVDSFDPLTKYADHIACLAKAGKVNTFQLNEFLKEAANLIENAPAGLLGEATSNAINKILKSLQISPLNRFKYIMNVKEFVGEAFGYGNITPEKAKTLITSQNGNPQCVLAGHTHFERIDEIGSEQYYVNTGTWQDKLSPNEANPCEPIRLPSRHLTLLVRNDPPNAKPYVSIFMYYFSNGPLRRFKKVATYVLK